MKNSGTYLTGPQVLARYGISDMSLHRWLNNPDLNFPRPMKINRRRYFLEVDLIAWERARAGRAAA
jgi:predicted DNA-binding transcriptional regulator AlpA